MTKWTEDRTLAAADAAASLSILLKQDDLFKENALRWLKIGHVKKFHDAIDAHEAGELRKFADTWVYTNKSNTSGFPLIDWLWVIAPSSDWQRGHLDTSNAAGKGRDLVVRLAEFEPTWIGRWWKSCSKTGFNSNDGPICRILVLTLTQDELRNHIDRLDKQVIADLIRKRPDLLDALPLERWGKLLAMTTSDSNYRCDLATALTRLAIPSDASAIIDSVIDMSYKQKVEPLSLLSDLVGEWQGGLATDPVAQIVTRRHKRLDEILRSFWDTSRQPTEKKGDNLWVDRFGRATPAAIISATRAAPDHFCLEIGFSVGRRMGEDGQDPSMSEISDKLKKLGFEATTDLISAISPMVELWASLRTLAIYEGRSWDHRTELVGLRAKVASIAASSPHLWAQALPWILVRASALGDVADAATLELACTNGAVRDALEQAGRNEVETVRLRARGLLALLQGLEDPEAGLARTLADAAAHHMDGSPIFPHPLAPVSATWLGSRGVERTLAGGVRRACDRFAAEMRDQGGDIEEALTKALIKEIEVEFREAQPRLKLLGVTGSKSAPPILSVRQCPASKSIEEPVYGCDIAWLLNCTVRGRLSATWVELVQVKKSSAVRFRRNIEFRRNSWKIDSKQLEDITKWSATATYWLIGAAGEILVIPAKYLHAIRAGRSKTRGVKTFSVGYHEIRSSAIPLEQYMVDLLIGQWVGTSSEATVRFAKGEDGNIRPRIVVEVTISVGIESQ